MTGSNCDVPLTVIVTVYAESLPAGGPFHLDGILFRPARYLPKDYAILHGLDFQEVSGVLRPGNPPEELVSDWR